MAVANGKPQQLESVGQLISSLCRKRRGITNPPTPSPAAPDHQPQECMGLLECMHNHLQIQTKMVQAQFSLLEGLQESLSLLQATSERRGRQQDNSETGHQGLTSASK